MLKNLVLENLNVRLKKGTVLPIDGENVKYNETMNWSNDAYVLDTVDYSILNFSLKNKDSLLEVDTIENEDANLQPNAKIIAFKDNRKVTIQTSEGVLIEDYYLACDTLDNGEYLSLFGSDERHSKENDYKGSPLDILVNINTLVKYFDII